MRKIAAVLALTVLTPLALGAQVTLTPNIGLQVPYYQQTNWQVTIQYDLNRLDLFLSGNLPLPNLTVTNLPGLFAGLTGCGTIGYVYSPASNTCVANSATPFSSVTGGTNTTAAMIVGTGSTLVATGTGLIAATNAAALLNTPSLCSTGYAPIGILPNGNATGCASIGGGSGITQLTGDATAGPGTGSLALTLATVNSGPGTCGDATHVCQVTTNAKGLTTNQSAVAITVTSPTITQKNCLSVSCAGGSTYSAGSTYTNASGAPVTEWVIMGQESSYGSTGCDYELIAVVNGLVVANNGLHNVCAGSATDTFTVPASGTFSATISHTSGGTSSFAITGWAEQNR